MLLKELGKSEDAKKIHLDILKRAQEAGLDRKIVASSLFELGVISFAAKEWSVALKYFSECLRHKFNVAGTRFYRGVIYFNQKNYDDALADFSFVINGESSLLKAQSFMYTAKIFSALERYDDALGALYQGRIYIEEQLKQSAKNAQYADEYKDLLSALTRSVEQIDKRSWFKAIGFYLGHDSNVLGVPESGSVADFFSKKSSATAALKAQVGTVSSIFASSQRLWAYQFYGNYTSEQETEIGRFLTNDFNFINTWNHLLPVSHSVRVHLNGSFQYQRNLETQTARYSPYNVMADLSYSLRKRLNQQDTLLHEVLLRHESFLLDPVFTDYMKKTGPEMQLSTSWVRDAAHPLWNPRGEVRLRQRSSKGTEFRYVGGAIHLGNTFYLNPKNNLLLGLNYGMNAYNERPGTKRKDRITQLSLDWTYVIKRSLKSNLSYQWYKNDSNITDVYKFDRQTFFAGDYYTF